MLALTVGVVVFGHQTSLLTSWRWTILGLVFAMILYFMTTYTAFFGGIMLAIYTMSLWPLMAKRVVNFPAHRVLPLAMLVYVFYMLLSAWVVAYNFVPGGTLTRERTDVMLVMLVLSCGLGSRTITMATAAQGSGTAGVSSGGGKSDTYKRSALRKKADIPRNSSTINFLGHMIRRLSTVTEEGEGEDGPGSPRESATHKVLSREVSVAEDKEAQSFHDKVLQGQCLLASKDRSGKPTPYDSLYQPEVVFEAIAMQHP